MDNKDEKVNISPDTAAGSQPQEPESEQVGAPAPDTGEKAVSGLWARLRTLPTALKIALPCAAALLAAGITLLSWYSGYLSGREVPLFGMNPDLVAVPEPTPEPTPQLTQLERLDLSYRAFKQSKIDSFYNSTEVIIDFRGDTPVRTIPTRLKALFTPQESFCNVTFVPDHQAVCDYIQQMADKYCPSALDCKYSRVKTTRDTVIYPDYDPGFILDVEATALLFEQTVLSGGGKLEAVFNCTGYTELCYGFTGTVIEVSLANQYLWMYKDNHLLVETPVVTGCPADASETPWGRYYIYWKDTDLYLRGSTWNDHVDYWMPFYGNYGIHDADWRDEFGGDIYKEDGSHGCINTPTEAMKIIFENSSHGTNEDLYDGTPIIIY